MNKVEAKTRFTHYLKEHGIHYAEHLCDGGVSIVMMFKGCAQCPDGILEGCVYFFDTCMETRVYYNENASSWLEKHDDTRADLYRLLNFLNAFVWPRVQGKLYIPSHLFTPRFYLSEDGGHDLLATTVIDYDVYEMARLESEDFVTKALPELLNLMSPPIFSVVLGKITVDQAICIIKREVLKEAL